ncbi:MAG: hypothetical protein JW751_32230 [Polyangiaceae bacterium]|nr:hypothetical protein [Polyangiaceae bacterium]
MAKLGAWLAVAVAATSARWSLAQPTVWDVARDPESRLVERKYLEVERIIETRIESVGDLMGVRRAAERLLAGIDALARTGSDAARLDAILGALYSEPYLRNHAEARSRLERALAGELPATVRYRAYSLLGVACARLEAFLCEREAYTRALTFAVDPDERALAFMNRGEVRMRLGDLRGAIADGRRAKRLATSPELLALSAYGLGVALERSGDLPSALRAMLDARAAWPSALSVSALDYPDVFFVPEFEVHYYKALEALAVARASLAEGSTATAAQHFDAAIAAFEEYLRAAEPVGTPWARNARLHLSICRRERAELPVTAAAPSP